MDIESILCPMCGKALESTRHIFFTCYIARDILCKISRWWDVTYTEVSSYEEWLDWILNLRLLIKYKHFFEGKWKWTSNEMACSKGSRIILGWNPDIVNVVIILFNDQVMHACIVFKAEKELFCSFIYAHNRYIQRRDLWNNLSIHKRYIRNRPWCILGDFNVSLSADESSAGSSFINTGMRDFQECVEDMEVADVNSTGLKFTWNRKPKGNDGILKKIDRIMANLEFNSLFMGACAVFQPYRISDHSSVVLRLPMNCEVKNRPFKLCNILVHNTRFKDIVTNGWSISVSGFLMYKVVKRLKGLKKPLRKLLYDKGNLHENVKKLRHELDEVQKSLDGDPSNSLLREEEAGYLKAFQDALIEEERFLFQKAKVEWLKLGEANTAYFHKVVKSQAARNRIDSITNMDGTLFDGDQVPKVASLVRINDYRLISCCNVLFKCIKLMHNYHLDRGPSRCAFKVDIQKAYDTVDWDFLREILFGFGFHQRKRGLHQGDPLSPYLFTLIMENLTLILRRRVRISNNFTYHRCCSQLNIINLCFADDLFLFAHGDVESSRVIMDSLVEFKNASGLASSLPKSTAYFCNVLNYVKIGILNILPFEEGNLPVKYLGVPSRLVYRDCLELMERIKRCVNDWKNKSLSFASRAQLIRYVLSLMHLYWASVFILPSSLMLELEQVMRGFLWCQGEMKNGKAK
ncbi:RNA-directed DNA polymerase, eukaryota, reverse transcriptase zinc-binding domain protein, partial [Tanacetum coccineum]